MKKKLFKNLKRKKYSKIIEKHEFSFYYSNLSKEIKENIFQIFDEKIEHRLKKILRIKNKEKIILFNDEYKMRVTIIDDNKLFVQNTSLEKNQESQTHIKLFIGLTKKDTLKQILFTCGVFGIQTIIPIITNKVQYKLEEKDHDLLYQKILSGIFNNKNRM
jgi:RsmE family RNA methyltransferase